MKNTIKTTISTLLALMLCLCMVSCGNSAQNTDLWQSATYTEDAELGSGAKTLYVDVVAGEKTVTFTLKTDKETVGEALLEQKLISGEQGSYGMFIKTVNGIWADYDKTQSYWSFNKDGEYMQNGVDTEKFADGAHYELVYTSSSEY